MTSPLLNKLKKCMNSSISKRTVNIVNKFTDRVEETAINYGISMLKNAIGVEHIFTVTVNGDYVIDVVNTFISKYDKYSSHRNVALSRENNRRIVNTQFITLLDSVTGMYVAAGNCLDDTEERYFRYNSLSDCDIKIFIFGYNAQQYSNELTKLVSSVNTENLLGMYNVTCRSGRNDDCSAESMYITCTSLSPRDLETLYFSNNEKEIIVNHIERFNTHRQFYEDRQLLYKTGILLYGEPGTGKSSIVKTLATKYKRSIVNVNLATLQNIDLNTLAQSIIADDREYIVLFEDIDTLFLNRTSKELDKNDNLIVNKLLQFLDSNSSPTNVIFIATTNHIERLDAALLREGRFDLKVDIKPLERTEALLFGKSFDLSEKVVTDILDTMDVEQHSTKNSTYNQAKLQARLLARVENRSYEDSVKLHCEV